MLDKSSDDKSNFSNYLQNQIYALHLGQLGRCFIQSNMHPL